MPTVTARRTADLTPAERDAVIELCVAAHDSENFRALFSFLPPDGLHFLGHDGADLVGHAVVTTRWLQPGDPPPLRTAYVDAVSTAPDRQGRGIGSAVMRALTATIAADWEIAALETDRVGFYARLGWQEWRGPLAGREPDGTLAPTPDQRGVMVLTLPRTPALDLDGPCSIERQPARIW